MDRGHELLCSDAANAISKVHGDTDVTLEETLSSLTDLREHLDMLIDAVEHDIKNNGSDTREMP